MKILKILALAVVLLSCAMCDAASASRLPYGNMVVAKKARKERKQDRKADVRNRKKKFKGGKHAKELKLRTNTIEDKRDLRNNVKRFRGSVAYIKGIPMIDQGNRPTCAICTVKRLLCYYTGTTPKKCPISTAALESELGYNGKGTDTWIMVNVLQKHAPKLHLSCDRIYSRNMSDEQKLEEYNKFATKYKKSKKVDLSNSRKDRKLVDYLKKIDRKLWMKLCNEKFKDGRKQAWKAIVDNVDKGIPICWGVELGLSQDAKRAKDIGAHLRMIIGYDARHQKVFYSDTWGPEHAKKEMSWDEAWSITNEMIVLKPMH